jgi:hypothetical protein
MDDEHSVWLGVYVGDWITKNTAGTIRLVIGAEFTAMYEPADGAGGGAVDQ